MIPNIIIVPLVLFLTNIAKVHLLTSTVTFMSTLWTSKTTFMSTQYSISGIYLLDIMKRCMLQIFAAIYLFLFVCLFFINTNYYLLLLFMYINVYKMVQKQTSIEWGVTSEIIHFFDEHVLKNRVFSHRELLLLNLDKGHGHIVK